MRILMTESSPSAAAVRDVLELRGHDVVTCTDDASDGPCRAASNGDACPLDVPTDLALVARRPDETDSLFEMGAVCAERHRVPVRQIDPSAGRWSVLDIVNAAAGGLDRAEAACAGAVRAALARSTVAPDATVEVQRGADRWHVVIGVAEDASPHRSAIANRASSAVRTHDPFVRVIDVSVVVAR